MGSLSGVLYMTLVCYAGTQVSCLTKDARDKEASEKGAKWECYPGELPN